MTTPMLSVCTASLDREEEWRQCCAYAMGFEWVDRFEEVKSGEELKEEEFHPIQQVINLIDDDDLKEDCDENWQNESKDHWTENALRIQGDLRIGGEACTFEVWTAVCVLSGSILQLARLTSNQHDQCVHARFERGAGVPDRRARRRAEPRG